jgi:phenylalanine ammonia-lyase
LGPSLNLINDAAKAVTTEINSTTDNPLFDYANGRYMQGGNFQATSMAIVNETLRIALQHMGKLMFAQNQEVLNNDLSKGLPPNLAVGEPSMDYGFKGVDISMASY